MTQPLVRFVVTGPLRAVVFKGFGAAPEPEAFKKLTAWAAPHGLLEDKSDFLLLGRNNPPPPPEGGDYGYEYFLTIPADMDVSGADVTTIPPATYAVIRANLGNIGERWQWLYGWVNVQGFSITGHGYEEHLVLPNESSPERLWFDLWLPVEKPQ